MTALLILFYFFVTEIQGQHVFIDTIKFQDGKINGYGPALDGKRIGLWNFSIYNGRSYKTIEYYEDSTVVVKHYKSQPFADGTLINPIQMRNTKFIYNDKYYLYQIDSGRYDDEYQIVVSGYSKTFYPTKKIASKGLMKNNIRIGQWTFYYQNGNLRNIIEYDSAGNYNGIFNAYYDNKNNAIWIEGRCKKNAMVGEWTEYYESGAIVSKGSYSDSVIIIDSTNLDSMKILHSEIDLESYLNSGLPFTDKTGWWFYYGQHGELIREEFWENGKRRPQ